MEFHRSKPYSQDLREGVFAAADESAAAGRIATNLRASVSYVSKVFGLRRYRSSMGYRKRAPSTNAAHYGNQEVDRRLTDAEI